jgi:exopolyphosphatase/pppGpp-phosphohydrolase
LILITLMKYFGVGKVIVSSHGLRYGLVKSLMVE